MALTLTLIHIWIAPSTSEYAKHAADGRTHQLRSLNRPYNSER